MQSKFEARWHLLQVQNQHDPEYQSIYQDYLVAAENMQSLSVRLTPADREIIVNLLGTLAELQLREIELALMLE